MAEFIIESPDGEKYNVTAPDGATEEQVMSYFHENYKGANSKEDATPKQSGIKADLQRQLDVVGKALYPGRAINAISNAPGDAVDVASGVASAVAHPIDTASAIGTIFRGLVNKIPGAANPNDPSVAVANKVIEGLGNNLGSINNFRNYVENHPISAAMDASGIAGLSKAGFRAAGMAKAAEKAAAVEKALDPIAQTVGGVNAGARAAYEYGTGMTTGSGKTAINEALQGTKAFQDAMRGNTTETEILGNARSSLENIKETRGKQYRDEMGKLKDSTKELDISGIKAEADDWLKRYNVTLAKDGALDFSRSTLRGNEAAANEVKKVYDIVREWGEQAGDKTPVMLDTLKRTIGESYSSDRTSRAMISAMEKKVKSTIESAIPDYSNMTREYAKATQLIDEMEKALSIGKKSSDDTAIRKFLTAIRSDNTYRQGLVQTLGEHGAQDLIAQISGLAMRPVWSQRLGPMLTTIVGAGGAYGNPASLAAIPLASPRVVGEFSVLAGKAGRGTGKVYRGMRSAVNAGYQGSRIDEQ